jgi:simple sugar transport system ATP-binding protein
VIYNGRLVADADPATITPEELGSAMTGAAAGHLEHDESGAPSGATEAAPEDEAR